MARFKRILSMLLAIILCVGVLPISSIAATPDGLSNFVKRNSFKSDIFSDVTKSDWFYDDVKTAYELGLMLGRGENTFDTESGVTIAETITIAARIHSIYYTGSDDFDASTPWYKVYADYASANGILYSNVTDYAKTATRAEFVSILANALPAAALEEINKVAANAIPDVKTTDAYGAAVYKLYRAGIMIGNDEAGTFAPDSEIRRSEVAAISARMADKSLRKSVQLGNEYTITFDMNGKGKQVPTQTVVEGYTAEKPADPSKATYVFKGWYTQKAGGSAYDFSTPVYGDVTLYARWEMDPVWMAILIGMINNQNRTYTVSFESNGGTPVASQTVKQGETAVMPVNPNKYGFTFGGWYVDGAFTIAYDFSAVVNSDIVLYAKWNTKSAAEEYYENNSELIEIINVEESNDVFSEADVKSLLVSKGFGNNLISYDYSITGTCIGDTEVSDGSANKHPMYQTLYLSTVGDAWAIYVINGSLFANPVSFNLESNLDAQLLVSETETLTSYDDATNQFFVTIPHESEIIMQTVNKIDAETLNELTIEELCNLSGATVTETTDELISYSESAIMLLSYDLYTLNSSSNSSRYSSDNPLIIVSLGDSYSSGEGIEKFYGQDKALNDKVRDDNWLAHRSQQSWPSLLEVPGIEGTMADYMVPLGTTSSSSCRWYFAATSGATTWNFQNEFRKDYHRSTGWFSDPVEGYKNLPRQLDAFDNIQGDVDYVTLSIGGNDVGFADVVTTCAVNCVYLHWGATAKLEDQLNDTWAGFDTVKANIKKAYEDVRDAAGSQAAIIVAGYPQLLDPNGKGVVINKGEAQLVNKNVSRFNDEIEAIVTECSNAGMNIYFVDVEAAFSGHEAYSNSPWINKIIFSKQEQDLSDQGVGSAYSVHPNKQGAQAYARLVNAKIEEIENRKSYHNISGVITIADTDMDMTNNIPLEGALVSLEYTGYMSMDDYTSSTGEYTLQNIPEGTYQITVSRDGYIPVTETIHVTEYDGEVIFNIAIEAISEEHSGVGFASGQIFDVGTGRPVSGLTLYIRDGLENITGPVIGTVYMNDSTIYSTTIGLEAGNYTIQIVDERTGISEEARYVTSHFNIKILGGMTIDNQNGYVSNGLVSDELRVVLTWGSTPNDLDSHMVGPDGVGGKFHEYYPERNDGSDSDLDVDDTSSYGPETITVYKEHDGTYVYAVHDYTNRSSSSSTALANSGAQVNVYRGNQLLATYNVPTNQGGTLWTVFSYDSTTQRITTINEMSYNSSSGDGVLVASTLLLPNEVSYHMQNESEYEEYIAIIMADIFSASKEQN